MGAKLIQTGPNPAITFQTIHGNLQIKGWEQSEVQVKASSDEDLSLKQEGDSLQISCLGDCVIRLPSQASVDINTVNGSVRLKLLSGSLHIKKVMGSLALRETGSVTIDNVFGDVLARQVSGGLVVDQVHGNVLVRDVQVGCRLEQISGNLELRDINGDLYACAGGNVRVRLADATGSKYEIEAGGNLHCRVPSDANLKVSLDSGAEHILLGLEGSKEVIRSQRHELVLGDGRAAMKLGAGGEIVFSTQPADWSDQDFKAEIDEEFASISEEFGQNLAEQVQEQLEAQMGFLEDQMTELGSKLGRVGLSDAEVERIVQRARQASERATERAQEKMRRTQERLERKLSNAARKAEIKARAAERRGQTAGRRSWSFEWHVPTGPQPPRPPREPASEEERLMILRMLEQKKISLEEAEELLAALEGKSD
jgi:hypothetical protein